jgi:hypothetical protein
MTEEPIQRFTDATIDELVDDHCIPKDKREAFEKALFAAEFRYEEEKERQDDAAEKQLKESFAPFFKAMEELLAQWEKLPREAKVHYAMLLPAELGHRLENPPDELAEDHGIPVEKRGAFERFLFAAELRYEEEKCRQDDAAEKQLKESFAPFVKAMAEPLVQWEKLTKEAKFHYATSLPDELGRRSSPDSNTLIDKKIQRAEHILQSVVWAKKDPRRELAPLSRTHGQRAGVKALREFVAVLKQFWTQELGRIFTQKFDDQREYDPLDSKKLIRGKLEPRSPAAKFVVDCAECLDEAIPRSQVQTAMTAIIAKVLLDALVVAADRGDAKAQNNLGLMYDKGKGVPQDYAEAAWRYRLAADQGNADAQNNLGRMYAKGQGVPQDYVQAHMWFNLAATTGKKSAVSNRDEVAKKMTPAQIEPPRDCRRPFGLSYAAMGMSSITA